MIPHFSYAKLILLVYQGATSLSLSPFLFKQQCRMLDNSNSGALPSPWRVTGIPALIRENIYHPQNLDSPRIPAKGGKLLPRPASHCLQSLGSQVYIFQGLMEKRHGRSAQEAILFSYLHQQNQTAAPTKLRVNI